MACGQNAPSCEPLNNFDFIVYIDSHAVRFFKDEKMVQRISISAGMDTDTGLVT